ncbi:MAG: DNA polymerase I [Blastocatellia bacterium]
MSSTTASPSPSARPKRLFLIDGMSNLYRSFYAIRNLSNSRGLPTNAIYGFAMMLRKLTREHHPDYLGVVLDSKEPTYRQQKYPEYKAHRAPMPDEMVAQLPYLDRLCEALRIPIVRLAHYEADDIMGTLARQATEAGVQTVLVTQDKDLSQLVDDPWVSLLRVERAERETREVFLDEAGVLAKFGVRPSQIVDWLGLKGDAVDGFGGGWGIGEKGAILLLEQFGDLEHALTGWESVKRKAYRESLEKNADYIRLCRELARIDLSVPVTLDLDALQVEEPDSALAHALFAELEFAQLTKEFAAASQAARNTSVQSATPERASTDYTVRTTGEEMGRAAKQLVEAEELTFRLHANPRGELMGVAVATAPGRAEYWAIEECTDRPEAMRALATLLGGSRPRKVTHDWKRALHLLRPLGIELQGVEEDLLLAGYLLHADEGRYDPQSLTRQYLEEAEPMLPPAPAAAAEVDRLGQVAQILTGKLADDRIEFPYQQQTLEFVYREIDLPIVPLLYRMERAGVRIDPQALATLSVEMEAELERLSREIYREAGREFNIASPAQLGEIFEELHFEVSRRTATGKIATGRDVLEELAVRYRLPQLVIEHRECAKLKGTYVDALPVLIDPADGRIHTTLNQTVTATGRLSSSDPNLQNIPIRTEMGRRIRRAFLPAEGCLLLSADYSQIELRLLAHISQDPVMLDAFRHGEDIHERTARAVFGARTPEELREKRRVAKIVNFGIAYVIGPYGLAQRVGISRAEAKRVIEDYYRTYAGVKRYMDELPDRAREADCTVRSLFGRRRRLPELRGKGAPRAGAEREAINLPMQGSASDLVKLAMRQVDEVLRRERMQARMILQIHDELVFEVPREEIARTSQLVKETMEQVARLDVPLVVDLGVGENWMDAKP